ncbi:tRNA1(Val) (adenine(37)-N6)-methyltransferase [Pseudanabaena yagii]|uniref:tRNA1(Val) (adenine(37)-N6)-methyltransferase n=1 Tax=Pseudanabaena yagii GIHE-NHR1 TaxID=2722753 RepID=A0ABX1LM10_9CYAN|nr:methyltransferase [Pseudanabaena yagii]NMF57123.1 methyltransferase [Pseudanabaena yagii GIHE-NHR1]
MGRQNHSFFFKQFAIYQDQCAMKVGTDGILLGAWVNIPENAQILDIGTGTGLLALMLAQRSQTSAITKIDAIEIDDAAYRQAQDNIQNSPWGDRINIYHGKIQDFAITCPQQYDLIISNPPFFEKAYKALETSRTLARHGDSLLQTDILHIASRLLKLDGHLAVIYPTDLAHKFLSKAREFGLWCDRQVNIKPMLHSSIKRIALELSKTQFPPQETTLTIEESKHIYTEDYISLVKDFYLNL